MKRAKIRAKAQAENDAREIDLVNKTIPDLQENAEKANAKVGGGDAQIAALEQQLKSQEAALFETLAETTERIRKQYSTAIERNGGVMPDEVRAKIVPENERYNTRVNDPENRSPEKEALDKATASLAAAREQQSKLVADAGKANDALANAKSKASVLPVQQQANATEANTQIEALAAKKASADQKAQQDKAAAEKKANQEILQDQIEKRTKEHRFELSEIARVGGSEREVADRIFQAKKAHIEELAGLQTKLAISNGASQSDIDGIGIDAKAALSEASRESQVLAEREDSTAGRGNHDPSTRPASRRPQSRPGRIDATIQRKYDLLGNVVEEDGGAVTPPTGTRRLVQGTPATTSQLPAQNGQQSDPSAALQQAQAIVESVVKGTTNLAEGVARLQGVEGVLKQVVDGLKELPAAIQKAGAEAVAALREVNRRVSDIQGQIDNARES